MGERSNPREWRREAVTASVHLRYRGKVDRVEETQARGWALIEGVEDHPVLEIVQDGELLGIVEASLYRADLEHSGIRDGSYAFIFDAPDGVTLDPALLRAFFLGTAVALRPPQGAGGVEDAVTTQSALIRDAVLELKANTKSRLPALERLANQALSAMQESADNTNKALGRIERRVADLEYGVAGHTIQTFMERYLAEEDRLSSRKLNRLMLICVLILLAHLGLLVLLWLSNGSGGALALEIWTHGVSS